MKPIKSESFFLGMLPTILKMGSLFKIRNTEKKIMHEE